MWTRCLVRLLFVARTVWLRISDFCNVRGEWVGHGVEDHGVRDSHDIGGL